MGLLFEVIILQGNKDRDEKVFRVMVCMHREQYLHF